MSRVGKKPIMIPSGVQVGVDGSRIKVKGPKGELQREIDASMSVKVSDGTLVVDRSSDSKYFKAMHGLYRSLLNNMVVGVARGFEKKLEIVGVGFKAEMKNKRLTLQIGYSHPIIFVPPPDINIACETPTMIAVSGVDKELVGQIAAKIRSFRPPEPYKGKGIKYTDEVIRRKAGKTAGS
ncbi:50S ribosomal protein L6 [candidate division KSB1 bacterium]|nr:50S ribosomal protein L6 [candidate division KSB1 bacterium]